jgi:hypothetical protein
MTFKEFKAWLDGYSHTINECPTQERLDVIKKKMDDVCENSTCIPINPFFIPTSSTPLAI